MTLLAARVIIEPDVQPGGVFADLLDRLLFLIQPLSLLELGVRRRVALLAARILFKPGIQAGKVFADPPDCSALLIQSLSLFELSMRR